MEDLAACAVLRADEESAVEDETFGAERELDFLEGIFDSSACLGGKVESTFASHAMAGFVASSSEMEIDALVAQKL